MRIRLLTFKVHFYCTLLATGEVGPGCEQGSILD